MLVLDKGYTHKNYYNTVCSNPLANQLEYMFHTCLSIYLYVWSSLNPPICQEKIPSITVL